jgi:lysophospholipase L1-like esterase
VLFQRYVALGDSQTEGMNDLDAHGGIRGWADRFAVYLAESNPDLLYANLAIRGRRTKRVRADQLDPALALNPDLVSVMAGANDVLGSFVLDETMCDPRQSSLLRTPWAPDYGVLGALERLSSAVVASRTGERNTRWTPG